MTDAEIVPEIKSDFYQRLRGRMRARREGKSISLLPVEYIFLLPDAIHLMFKLIRDDRIPGSEKTKTLLILTYVISPIDLVPESFLGPLGLVDDIPLLIYGVNSLINQAAVNIAHEHWAGHEKTLKLLQAALRVADNTIGAGRWRKIIGLFKKKKGNDVK